MNIIKDINPEIFRGYDIRGIVDKDLDEDVYYTLGKAYATFLFERRINEAVVGRDVRLTSEKYQNAFVEGLLESGINVFDIGLTLSQILYFAQYHFLSKGAAMITASHNPANYNGLKLAVGFSDTLLTDEVQQIRKIAESGNFKTFDAKGKVTNEDVFPFYVKDLFKRVPIENAGFKVVIEGLNATAGKFLPDILRKSGCEVIEQNTNLDGSFPLGTPDPTERDVLERLAKRVIQEKADMGLSYDSDGDRIGIVDNEGNLIWNDVLVAIFAKDILEYMPGAPIIFNTLCSKATSDVIESSGGKPVMWLTGHSFIKAKIKEMRSPFGGELSGHIFFMDNAYGHDDTCFATLRLFSYLKRKSQSFREAVLEIPKYVSSPEIKLGLADSIKFKLINEKISQDIKTIFPDAKYIDIDGFRADSLDEMVIIRASQNGPYVTIKFEAKTQEKYDELKLKVKEILTKYPEIDWKSGVNIHAFE
ncbi:MAG: Phosphomannomutase [Candidatus Woesebacteria bacterium GW2011_GWC2_33_12]|uniref:Phosphomannomutase n=1 Tax=Candidatus Woesebacteria bacterium GW2011_GWB1_33_22 TaxID=1618566 RepID=A0A0F9ZLH9_9BACT|nr:MAG: Phosphomannomutase [Candidatus Woesebacteria bacterium GW2011_GWC2_33_12]KKP42273.1 MAG: Phosphomannomutase [Candidatus Woesebacteria bacterium GW2011_GWA2_33_20]KKP45004.1 MAG: Phosphomannomutase [Candidatus Woesebacteria bacterium GW2011_GWB1_33_22]KKP46853.1 MAG: Phosphomannomutase [Microgenomates group bacterium GW2011_GWC1_33_28]KKP50725.1 MAG: Phosphomannomutase [Candidatus Woesebacteria bacterium GW2011_GWA1_33_33]HCR36475.1 phosphomannomutase [Candidatus Woesebacteria bacterium